MSTILPDGWFSKENEEGNTYYYDIKGRVSWLPPPPRPLAPTKIITFKEEYSTVIIKEEEEEEEEEYYDKWVVDDDDVGLPVRHPCKTAEVAKRIADEGERMIASNRKLAGRFEISSHTWGGEPHPRLGSGERMRLGYRPPPPWQESDTVATAAKSVSKNTNREWVVEGPKTVTTSPTEIYLVRAPMGGFHGSVVQVVSSDEHSFLRTSEGLVYSWGRNVFGQLGLGDVETRAVPCLVTSIAEDWVVTSLSCGGSHVLALTKARKATGTIPKYQALMDDGQMLWSWGKGRDGALGLGMLYDRHEPQIVKRLSDTSIVCCSAGATNSLAATSSGELYSWGNNNRGLCGLGDAPRTQAEVILAGIKSQQSRPDTGYSSGYSSASSSRPTTRPGTSGSPTRGTSRPRSESENEARPETSNSPRSCLNQDMLQSSFSSQVVSSSEKYDAESEPSRDGHLCVSLPTKCPTVVKGVKLVACGKFHAVIVCGKAEAEECLAKAASARKSRRKAERKRLEKEEKNRLKMERASIANANSKNRWNRKGKKQVVPREDSSDEEETTEKSIKSIKKERSSSVGSGSVGVVQSLDDSLVDNISSKEELVVSDIESGSVREDMLDIPDSVNGELLLSEHMSSSLSYMESRERQGEFLDGFGPDTRGSVEEAANHMGEIKAKKLSYQGQEVVLLTWGYGNRAALGLGIENSDLDIDIPTILPVPVDGEAAPWVVPAKGYNPRFDMEEVLSIECSCHTVLLTGSGGGLETHVYTWGDADHGKCGVEPPKKPGASKGPAAQVDTGVNTCVPVAVHVPTKVSDLEGKRVVCVTAGGFATCVSTADGKVYACGFVGNGVTMDRVAQQREVLDIPRPRQLVELTEPRFGWKGVDVVDVKLGMRHAIVITTHHGCLRELTILDNIEYLTNKFGPLIESMSKQIEVQVETVPQLQHDFDAIVPDSSQLLQPLLNEAYERGLNGHPIVVAGEQFESDMADLRSNILSANDNILRKYLCCWKNWSQHIVSKPPSLKRRQKRIHKSKSSKPKGPKDGRSKGDPNFKDGASVK